MAIKPITPLQYEFVQKTGYIDQIAQAIVEYLNTIWLELCYLWCCLAYSTSEADDYVGTLLSLSYNFSREADISRCARSVLVPDLPQVANQYGFEVGEEVAIKTSGVCHGCSLLFAKAYLTSGDAKKAGSLFTEGAPYEAMLLQGIYTSTTTNAQNQAENTWSQAIDNLPKGNNSEIAFTLAVLDQVEAYLKEKPAQSFMSYAKKNHLISQAVAHGGPLYVHLRNLDRHLTHKVCRAPLHQVMMEDLFNLTATRAGLTQTRLIHYGTSAAQLTTTSSMHVEDGAYLIWLPTINEDSSRIGKHAITFVKEGDTSYLFDPNEGVFHAQNGKNLLSSVLHHYMQDVSSWSTERRNITVFKVGSL